MTAHLDTWVDAPGASKSVLFIPGFMTDPLSSTETLGGEWKKSVSAVAKRLSASAHVLDWPAGNFADIALGEELAALARWIAEWNAAKAAVSTHGPVDIDGHGVVSQSVAPSGDSDDWDATLAGAAATAQTSIQPMNVLPLPEALTIQLVASAIPNALKAWNDANERARQAGAQGGSWFPSTKDVVLIAHSLGARVALDVLAHGHAPNVGQVVLLAPAVPCDHAVAGGGAAPQVTVFHSKNDFVLWALYRAGQGTLDHALGLRGPCKGQKLTSVSTPQVVGQGVHHGDYARLLRHLPGIG